ncbi:hypothetical protein ACLIN3_27440 (plasmid) [Pseudomonas orientalis]|uniref:hypothetical protein n=1 Tax=Pseudomonas orientalis TaxID=76758 RepID=UPI00398646E7
MERYLPEPDAARKITHAPAKIIAMIPKSWANLNASDAMPLQSATIPTNTQAARATQMTRPIGWHRNRQSLARTLGFFSSYMPAFP